MSRISEAFDNKKVFIGYITAGDPCIEKTEEFILKMAEAGAGIIEVGIPFSDPIADGPVIQAASVRALSKEGGCTTEIVFDMMARISGRVDIPLVFLTYLNPVFKYGYDAFCKKCSECGVDGIIIPDMPYEEKSELLPFAKKYDIDIISLIAPNGKERIEMIAKDSTGYIYVVSSLGLTGMRNEITTDLGAIIAAIRNVTTTPVAIGFGINKPEQASEYSQIADGIIVGSAIVKIIEEHKEHAARPIYDYIKQMINAM